MELGFRSSFNFIPEGEYRVHDELRHWLTANGFEVGVHDHRHDGKLYASRQSFRDSARIINQHLHAWNAVGFRSGFMLRNLDWIHDLDIAYDASTFDTDPFEPQPDGVGTIFPFWVPAPASAERSESRAQGAERTAHGAPDSGLRTPDSVKDGPLSPLPSPFSPGAPGAGYIELPYTLTQDSTLFLFLEATTIGIWQKKLRWIAARGGMALVNIHPDYIHFGSRPATRSSYPASLIREFLLHVKEQYAQDVWCALPKEVADYSVTCSPSVVL
jgi:hypothetical protein